MGKVRKKRFKHRHDPTLEDVQLSFKACSPDSPPNHLDPVGHDENFKAPLTEKLYSDNETERQWACHSVAQLVSDATSERNLVRADVIVRLTSLLEDPVWEVREAALGALRNLSLIRDGVHCEKLVKGNVVKPLVALIKQCGELLLKGGCCGEDTGPPFAQVLDHCLNLLLNLSEATDTAVEAFNNESAVHYLLQVASTCHVPISLRSLAAQCLQTITEDNPVAIQSITASSDLLTLLEGALTSYSQPSDSTQGAVVGVSLAGVLQNILLGLADCSRAVHLIVDTLTNILEVSPEHICCSLSDLCSGDNGMVVLPAFAQLRDQLKCVQMALEVLANLCYIEDEGEEDSEWEDVDEEMEGVMTDVEETMVSDLPEPSVHQHLALTLLCDRSLHRKLLSWCIQKFPAIPPANQELLNRVHCIQERAAMALLNMITSLPSNAECWNGSEGLSEVWCVMFQALLFDVGESFLPTCPEDALVAYLGVVGELASRFDSAGACVTFSEHHEKCIESICKHAPLPTVRATAVNTLGRIGRMSLHANPAEKAWALTAIASVLREQVAGDPSLWVVCEAMDAMFDILGSDDCPADIVCSPTLLPILRKTKKEFRTRLHRDKHSLKPHMGLVSTTRINLPKFIVYLENM